jgi:hypothetical protein
MLRASSFAAALILSVSGRAQHGGSGVPEGAIQGSEAPAREDALAADQARSNLTVSPSSPTSAGRTSGAVAEALAESRVPDKAGGAGSGGVLSVRSRARDLLPSLRGVEEGRYRLVEIRRKLERAYSKDWLKNLDPREDRESFVSRLGQVLSPEDLGFLSLVLTSLGEARGQVSEECRSVKKLETLEARRLCLDDKLARKNLLFVMKIIENRSHSDRFVDFRRRKGHPLGRLWGVVTQPLRYSSWNPQNPNLGFMMQTVAGAKTGEKAGDLANNEKLSVEDSVALDRALAVYCDYVSPEVRFKNFDRVIGSRVHRATHMLNWDEMNRLPTVPWTVEAILSSREKLKKSKKLSEQEEKLSIFVGLRLKGFEILLPGEPDGPGADRLAHIPVYIRMLRDPSVQRLRTLQREQEL